MSEESLALVRAWVELWSGRDLVQAMQDPAFAHAALDPLANNFELRWAEEMPDVETYRGHEGTLEAMREWLEPWEEFRMDPEEFIDAGERIVVTYSQTGRGKGSGVETTMAVTQIYTVQDGKIASLKEFSSRDSALEAAGLNEA